ncbi:hypothetical protein HUJ05_009765 [Dendroctonus ponderosae]|nr:hypothetical protein HUJ05_009765 [Dendroctonus ponderosae]
MAKFSNAEYADILYIYGLCDRNSGGFQISVSANTYRRVSESGKVQGYFWQITDIHYDPQVTLHGDYKKAGVADWWILELQFSAKHIESPATNFTGSKSKTRGLVHFLYEQLIVLQLGQFAMKAEETPHSYELKPLSSILIGQGLQSLTKISWVELAGSGENEKMNNILNNL